MDSVLEEKFKQIETWQFCLWRLVPSLELDYTGFNPVAMMLLLCFLASAKSWAPGSVAPDPDSNLNSSLISIPDSGKLGSGKILFYQALDLIQVADLIQVNSLNQADIMLPKSAGQQVSSLFYMF